MDNKTGGEALSHYQIVAAQRKQKEIKENKYKEKSKKRLANIISTKIKTSFIGAISCCEEHFGFLWGHGKPEEELDENEIAMREIWENVRAQILDNGNTQLRASLNEVGNYSISWDRYHMELKIKDPDAKEN
tara:strand:+ start:6035 stop:6430 length:396 start_codon:yes stop_codon:yes gene_type:complete